MNLLRRPLRPQLKPFLLNDIEKDGESEQLSPLSSVSSSESSSAPTSRPSTALRSPHRLPPLGEETERSVHLSVVTPFQSEQVNTVDRFAIDLIERERLKKQLALQNNFDQNAFSRQLNSRKQLTALKTREYSQFSQLPERPMTRQTRTLNKTPKFKGPGLLPIRRPRSFHDPKSNYAELSDDQAYNIANEFTFNDFILQSTRPGRYRYEETALERAILSRYTYKQICEIIAQRVSAERGESGKFHVQTLVPDIEPFQNRVPMHQIVTEMALLLRRHMAQILGSHLKMHVRTLPSWRQKEGAHTEILLYETEGTNENQENEMATVSKDNQHSLDSQRDTGAEIAVLDSLIRNGTHLDLRAFALERLPDISLMFSTLIAVDLSYNCLTTVPRELFQCLKLEHLYLRHNPINSIFPEISHLKSLVFLDLSFCQLQEHLPYGLCGLINLRHLDVSYNRLTTISRDIFNLKNLRQFVCDGNEITHFPASLLSMENLRLITAKNSWLLPSFAKEENSKKPPKLIEILAVRLSKFRWKSLMNKIPDSAKSLLFGAQSCDSCNGARVANGYRTIVNFQNYFGIKHLPILFVSCTPECLHQRLIKQTEIVFSPSTDSYSINEQFISRMKKRFS